MPDDDRAQRAEDADLRHANEDRDGDDGLVCDC